MDVYEDKLSPTPSGGSVRRGGFFGLGIKFVSSLVEN
jgi:hypothetical protein